MPKKYLQLSDCHFFIPGKKIEIWYAKPKFFLHASMMFSLNGNLEFNPKRPEDTHVFLGSIDGLGKSITDVISPPVQGFDDLRDLLFGLLQAEKWSPNNEANELIQGESCSHTSMSVGDMIRFNPDFGSHLSKPSITYICGNVGWFRF